MWLTKPGGGAIKFFPKMKKQEENMLPETGNVLMISCFGEEENENERFFYLEIV